MVLGLSVDGVDGEAQISHGATATMLLAEQPRGKENPALLTSPERQLVIGEV